MSYATLAELKSALRITDTVDDVLLQLALDTADDQINGHCDRTFLDSGATTPRSFRYYDKYAPIDDFSTTTGLVVSVAGSTLLADDYQVLPRNAPAYGRPFYSILFDVPPINFTFTEEPITVTARWGWATVPVAVREASLLQASRTFSRRLSPYGIAGSPETGSELRLLARLDPDVQLALAPYVKVWGVR